MTTLKPIIVEYVTMSGVRVHCTPVHYSTHQAIELKAAELFPYPDKGEYEQPMENAADSSIVIPADENPEYVGLVKDIDAQRTLWVNEQLITIGASYPDFPSLADMVAFFQPRLEQLREIAIIKELNEEAALTHCVYTGTFDRAWVLRAIAQQAPLKEGEVLDAMRLFRVDVSRQNNR